MQDTHIRSVIKAVSWRVFGTIVTIIIAFIITRKLDFSFYIGCFEFISKVVLFYLHERIWGLIPRG